MADTPDPIVLKTFEDSAGPMPFDTDDVTIGDVDYIVESFNPTSGSEEAVSRDGKGLPYRKRHTQTVPTGSMTLQFPLKSTPPPELFKTFEYKGRGWVITEVGETYGQGEEWKINITVSALLAASIEEPPVDPEI